MKNITNKKGLVNLIHEALNDKGETQPYLKKKLTQCSEEKTEHQLLEVLIDIRFNRKPKLEIMTSLGII